MNQKMSQSVVLCLLLGAVFRGAIPAESQNHTVTFEVTCRWRAPVIVMRKGQVFYKEPPRERMIAKKVWVKGDKMRRESDELIDIDLPDVMYRLWKKTKTGTMVRLRDLEHQKKRLAKMDPTRMFGALKSEVKLNKIGEEKVEDAPCDIYFGQTELVYRINPTETRRRQIEMKLWVRRKDKAVVKEVRTEAEGNSKTTTVTEYKNIRTGVMVEDGLFEVPRGYDIKDVTIDEAAGGSGCP